MSSLLAILKKPASTGRRYWRLLATDVSWTNYLGSNPYFQSIYTISFFASANGTGTDLCLGKTASAKSTYLNDITNFGPQKANDNSSATRWASNQGAEGLVAQWWKIDAGVGNKIDVRSVRLNCYGAGALYLYAKSFALQWSDDDVNWTTKSTFNTAQVGDNVAQLFQNL